jgi:hypothetical protein
VVRRKQQALKVVLQRGEENNAKAHSPSKAKETDSKEASS